MYAKPIGYNTLSFAYASSIYRPFNDYPSGMNQAYSPAVGRSRRLTLTFSAAPDDLSGFSVPDGAPSDPNSPLTSFVFTYGGAPGAGIIPLVGGCGTAAQAATATQVALAAQLGNWDVTNPSAGVVLMVYQFPGLNPALTILGDPNFSISTLSGNFGATLPGRFGKNFCFLPDTIPAVEG